MVNLDNSPRPAIVGIEAVPITRCKTITTSFLKRDSRHGMVRQHIVTPIRFCEKVFESVDGHSNHYYCYRTLRTLRFCAGQLTMPRPTYKGDQ